MFCIFSFGVTNTTRSEVERDKSIARSKVERVMHSPLESRAGRVYNPLRSRASYT